MTRALLRVAASLLPAVLFAQPADFSLDSDRAKVWDDSELNNITLPPVLPEGKIIYLPSDAYYKLTPLKIYKTYPVYSLDREPKDYFEWLRRLEPEIAFNPQKLKRESDWKRAGRIVFEAPTDFVPAETIHDRAWFTKVRPPSTRPRSPI